MTRLPPNLLVIYFFTSSQNIFKVHFLLFGFTSNSCNQLPYPIPIKYRTKGEQKSSYIIIRVIIPIHAKILSKKGP